MPSLTRGQMEAAIAAGGSVMIHNARGTETRVIDKVEDLPPESELAAGDAAREAAAEADLEARIGALAAEKAALRKRREVAQAQAPPAHVLPGTEPQVPAAAQPPEPPPGPEQSHEDEGERATFGRKKR